MLQIKRIWDLVLLLRHFVLVYFSLFIVSSIIEQFLMYKLEIVLRSDSMSQFHLWFYGILNFLNGIFFPLLLSYFILLFLAEFQILTEYQKKPTKTLTTENLDINDKIFKFNFFKYVRYWEALVIETLRGWGKIISWSFVFFIPGLYKYITYTFIPYIIMFDKNYSRGNVDVFQESPRVFKLQKWKTLLILFVFQLVLPIILGSLFDSYRNFKDTPMTAFLIACLQGLLNLISFIFLFEIYKKSVA